MEIQKVLNVQIGDLAGKRTTQESILNEFGFKKYFKPKAQ